MERLNTFNRNSTLRSMLLDPYSIPPSEPIPEILHRLKCNNCNGFLSCPPIYETTSGNICGRCPVPTESATRSKLYEILAEMASFPCKFSAYGCLESIKFLDEKRHDSVCAFKPVLCPIATDGSCNWMGPKSQLYNHCDTDHVSKIIHNSSPAIKFNAGKNLFSAYILEALGKLYLVHIKVCVVSKKIYYSMRYLDKHQKECFFRVDIQKNSDKITKMAHVLPEGDLDFVEDNSISVSFNSLFDILGPFDDIFSNITLFNKCAECRDIFKKLVYHADFGWICMECVPAVPKALLQQLSTPASKKDMKAKLMHTCSKK